MWRRTSHSEIPSTRAQKNGAKNPAIAYFKLPIRRHFYACSRRLASMEFQALWNTLIPAAIAVGGWFMKSIYEAIKTLDNDLTDHKVEAAKTYSTKTDIARIEDKLDRVLDKLDRKADK